MANAFVRDASSEGGPGDPTQATPFAVIQLLGLIFLTIIFATAVFAPSVKRSTPWFSLFIGWIISSASYNLLFFAQQQLGPDPAFSLCVTQGALIHSVPILQSGTVLSLMIHAWMFISIQLRRAGHAPKYQEVINTFLLLHPYTLSLTAFIGFAIFGVRNPETVARDSTGVYCNIFYHRTPSTVTAVIGAFLMLVALFFEAMLGHLLYQNWRTLKRREMPLAIVTRVLIFTSAGVLVIGVAFVYITAGDTTGFNWILSTMPFLAVLIFGTQKDLLIVWISWSKQGRRESLTNGSAAKTTCMEQTESSSPIRPPVLS